MQGRHELLIASNRGPVSFTRDSSGAFVEKRGVGGLVTAVSGAANGAPVRWLAMPMSESDRSRAQDPTPIGDPTLPGLTVDFVDIDHATYERSYEQASNRTIWFGLHGLAAIPLADEDWEAYRRTNAAMANTIAEQAAPGARVLVQDYHLCLVPGMLAASRPDLRVGFTWHVPFPRPDIWHAIDHADELLAGLDAARIITFHSARWSRRFTEAGAHHAAVRVAPLGVDAPSLAADANSALVQRHRAQFESLRDGRPLLVRADRVEPAKGVPLGIDAFARALETLGPRSIRHLIRLTPSRLGVPEYAAELDLIRARVAAINATDPEDPPVILEVSDDRARTFAALHAADAIIVSSLADGMNLVAREAPIINDHDAPLILSTETGASEVFGDTAFQVDPTDVAAMADAIVRAVTLPAAQRIEMAAAARLRAPGVDPGTWMREQFQAL